MGEFLLRNVGTALVSIATVTACASSQPADERKGHSSSCIADVRDDVRSRWEAAAGAIHTHKLGDLDGDRASDWAMSNSADCGTGGCAYEVYLSSRGCTRYAGTVHGLEIVNPGDRINGVLAVHAFWRNGCGGALTRYEFDGAGFAEKEAYEFPCHAGRISDVARFARSLARSGRRLAVESNWSANAPLYAFPRDDGGAVYVGMMGEELHYFAVHRERGLTDHQHVLAEAFCYWDDGKIMLFQRPKGARTYTNVELAIDTHGKLHEKRGEPLAWPDELPAGEHCL